MLPLAERRATRDATGRMPRGALADLPSGAPKLPVRLIHTAARHNITLVGAVGAAAGASLRQLTCALPYCSDALQACIAHPRCDTLEMRLPGPRPAAVIERRRKRGRPPLPDLPNVAILRAAYQRWGAPKAPELQEEVRLCRLQARAARNGVTPPGSWWTPARRARWRTSYCDEYSAAGNDSLPDLGYHLPLAPAAEAACPAPKGKITIVTYQNGPTPWLCTFLRTFGYHDVPVIVLGWQPTLFSRNNNVFYFTDRVYTTLRFLLACGQQSFQPGGSFMFCDTDEMLQVGMEDLVRLTQEVYDATHSSVAVSAEARCMPDRLGKLSFKHSDQTLPGMPKKWPRCLNTGNIVGRVPEVIDMLNRTCVPCRTGLSVNEIFRRYTRAYSQQVTRWIYSEQAELMRLYLAKPANVTGWVLDFQQRLFHPNFWYASGRDVAVLPDGRLMNRHTRSVSAFIHYNGDSKYTWKDQYSPAALSAALRRAYEQRTGDARLEKLDAFLSERVTFLGPTFQQDRGVTFAQICSKGAI